MMVFLWDKEENHFWLHIYALIYIYGYLCHKVYRSIWLLYCLYIYQNIYNKLDQAYFTLTKSIPVKKYLSAWFKLTFDKPSLFNLNNTFEKYLSIVIPP